MNPEFCSGFFFEQFCFLCYFFLFLCNINRGDVALKHGNTWGGGPSKRNRESIYRIQLSKKIIQIINF